MRVQLLLLKGCGCADLDEIYIYICTYKSKVVTLLGELLCKATAIYDLKNAKKNTGAGPSVHEVVEASGEACGLSIHLATPKSK
jgi:hypothetical protein